MKTRFTELVGCELPLQLATLGGVGTTELAAAVAAAGGLGMVPGGVAVPDIRGAATGTGFNLPFDPPLEVVTDAAARGRVVEFFYRPPRRDLVDAVHRAGALCAWQVGSRDEAVAAQAAGCDFVVAQGREAGGHVRGVLPLRDILAAVLSSVSVPVVAAGGLATADAVARVLAAGADAVRVGTRFVASEESDAHPSYKAALVAAGGPMDTVLTTHFDDDWPDAPHRVLRAALARAEHTGNRSIDPPSRSMTGDVSDTAMYAGEGVGAIDDVKDARAITDDLMGAVV